MAEASSPSDSKAGPTTLWKTLKGKNVKTNDGKDLGEIKEISDNYVHVQKGTIRKE
jgi:sporulation protein YlmC with PRC-barrel domain